MAVIDSGLYSDLGHNFGPARYITPLLDAIAAQAASADRSRSVDSDVIASIKRNDILKLSASPELGGLDETMLQIGCGLREESPRAAPRPAGVCGITCALSIISPACSGRPTRISSRASSSAVNGCAFRRARLDADHF